MIALHTTKFKHRRLLFITERFTPDIGGVAKSASRTAVALARIGLDVEVLSWTRTLPAGKRQTIEMPPYQVASGSLRVHRLGLFANLDYSLQHTSALLESLHREKPFDGVWGHYLSPAGFLAVLFGRTAGIPSTVSARGNDIDLMMFPPGDFSRLIWTLENASCVSAVSHDLANKIRVLTSDQLRVRVVPNSVDTEVFQNGPDETELRNSLNILPGETVFGFSGELRQKKGMTPLLAAFRQVRQEQPACLLVIGEVRLRDQAALAAFAAEDPESRNRMIVTGHIEDPIQVARHVRLCDLFLQPSYWDGLPNSVLEAMACERLVLASDAGGIPEVIENGTSGFLLPRADLDRLGEAILELLRLSSKQRQSIGQAARRRILDRFSSSLESAALEELLTDLWSGHGA